MTRNLVTIIAFFATCGLQGAIKKAEDQKPAAPPPAKPAENPADKPADQSRDPGLLGEMLKRSQRKGGQLKMNGNELSNLLRDLLGKQGVPKEQLKNATLMELMKLLREKNPNRIGGLRFGGADGAGVPFDAKIEKRLDDQYKELMEGHRPGTVKAAPAMFSFRDAKKPNETLAFGTGINADGWMLTKASEVKIAGELQCQVKSEWLAAKVVRIWDEHDLALVKVDAKALPVVQWSAGSAPVVGSFVTAVAPEGREPVAIGVVSVAVRNERRKGSGFLGVSLTADEKGLRVREVVPGGAAKASGMQREDRILELDGKKTDSVFTFTRMVSDRKPGEKVRLKLQRGNEVLEKEIALGDRGAQPGMGRAGFDKMNGMGSTVSKRKDDFPSVMQTDLPLQATQCGGPVTDLDGNVVGLVIARSGRVETMVLPSGMIRELLAGVDFSSVEKAARKQ